MCRCPLQWLVCGAPRMNADESGPAEYEGMLKHVDRDLELDFIREFSTGGELLKDLSVDNRRERIRVAIYTQKLPHMLFRDGPMTYAEAYAECFGRPLEMRSAARHQPKSEAAESPTSEIVAAPEISLSRVGYCSTHPVHRGPRRAGIKSSRR
jgi:hypothetical protein